MCYGSFVLFCLDISINNIILCVQILKCLLLSRVCFLSPSVNTHRSSTTSPSGCRRTERASQRTTSTTWFAPLEETWWRKSHWWTNSHTQSRKNSTIYFGLLGLRSLYLNSVHLSIITMFNPKTDLTHPVLTLKCNSLSNGKHEQIYVLKIQYKRDHTLETFGKKGRQISVS